jgi:hypothetical protein
VSVYPSNWGFMPRGWWRWQRGPEPPSEPIAGAARRLWIPSKRSALALVACVLPVLWAWQVLLVWNEPDEDLQDPWGDAVTYLAAGERLNDGHALYELGANDRQVLILPSFTAPLLSPPPIAAIWRPLTIIPFGFAAWVAACWVALLATVWYLVSRLGLPAAVVVAALSWPLGEQLAAANVSAFFPGLFLLAWLRRGDARWGALLGAMAALKLAPAVMGGWWAGRHGAPGLLAVTAGAVGFGIAGFLGAGLESYLAYLSIPSTTEPSSLSVAGRLGASWFPYVALVVGALAAARLGRFPRMSYAVAYVAMLVGTPAVYVATFGLLIGLLVPLISLSPELEVPERAGPDSDHEGIRTRLAWSANLPSLDRR